MSGSVRTEDEQAVLAKIDRMMAESKWPTEPLESFRRIDDFSASSLPPELYSKWCELVGYWSNFTTSLSGVQEAGKHY